MLPFLSLFECPLRFHLLVLSSIPYSFLIILCHISCIFIIYMTYGNPTISLLPHLLLVIFIIILVFFIFNKHIHYPKSLWKIKMIMWIFIRMIMWLFDLSPSRMHYNWILGFICSFCGFFRSFSRFKSFSFGNRTITSFFFLFLIFYR